PADRRRLVRSALGQAVLAHPRLRGDHAQGLRAQGPGGPRWPRDLAALYRTGRARRRQAADVDSAHEPAVADLAWDRHRVELEADGRDRRWMAAARLRAAADAGAAAVARGGPPAGRRRGRACGVRGA